MKNKKIDYLRFRHHPLGFLWFIMQEERWAGVLAVFSVVIATSIHSVLFIVIGKITDLIKNLNIDQGGGAIEKLFAVLIILLVFQNIFFRLSGFLASWWITKMEMLASKISFRYLLGHSVSFFADRMSGKLQSKIFNISRSMDALTGIILWTFLNLFVRLVFFIILGFLTHWLIGVVVLVSLMVIFVYSIFTSGWLVQGSKEYTEKLSIAKGVLIDVLVNILATKQNVAIKRETRNAEKALDDYRRKHLEIWRNFDIVLIFSNFITIAIIGFVLFASLSLWRDGIISIGSVVMLLTMLLGLYGYLESLSTSINRFLENLGKLKEGLGEIFKPYEIVDSRNAKKVRITKGEIVFEKVNFSYKDKQDNLVFQDLSLTIPAGQKVGLVGESGAGKSTFVNLLLRFLEVTSGVIKIDGFNISDIKQDDLRSAIAYVPQEALLFHRSVADNIKYSYPRANYEEMVKASKRANAFDFIQRLPNGFKTFVGERGVKLSGGQRQRLMIARAMLKKSPILVLDEATSSLDSRAEKLIQNALEKLMRGRTTIVIAHRLSTLKKMDRIIVFDDGRIVEEGSHNELLKLKKKYYQLWQLQTG